MTIHRITDTDEFTRDVVDQIHFWQRSGVGLDVVWLALGMPENRVHRWEAVQTRMEGWLWGQSVRQARAA